MIYPFTIDILTIENQEHRIHSLLGHIATIGFPVNIGIIETGHYRIINGKSYLDYDTPESLEKDILKDGYTQYEGGRDSKIFRDYHYICCEWSMLNCLKIIADSDKPSLLLENDAFFFGIDYEELALQWVNLIEKVGHWNLNVAQLTVDRIEDDLSGLMMERPKLTDFWAVGSRGQGQTANIYTPHGAQYILDTKPKYPNIEGWLFENQDEIEGLYSTNEPCISLNFYSNYDSPHTKVNNEEVWRKFLRGIN